MIEETPESILAFWFGDGDDDAAIARKKGRLWWSKNNATDLEIAARFKTWTDAAAAGKLDAWAGTPEGLLALILLTDQFPRNIYRGLPASFAFDGLALRWCLQGLEQGADRRMRPVQRVFLYIPLEHAESLAYQERAIQLFDQLLHEIPQQQKEAFAGFRDFAIRHRDIIARFGRFPHRNAILKRPSTEEERAFLQTPGSSF